MGQVSAMPYSIAQTSNDEVPIFWLPDKLLAKVCSYVIKISDKMKLEQVSKRLYFATTGVIIQKDGRTVWPSQSPGWEGSHKLEIMLKCFNTIEMNMQGNCNKRYIVLNNCFVPVLNWPVAVQSLIQRTQIHQLIVHCGAHARSFFRENPTVLAQITKIFKANHDKIKIEFLEFHYGAEKVTSGRGKIKPFLLNSLQMSIPYLKELVLNIDDRLVGNAPIWPLIHQCEHLKSITSNINRSKIDFDALIGKPLTKVNFGDLVEDYTIIDGVVQTVNGVSGEGVQNLSLNALMGTVCFYDAPVIDFKEFSDRLSENSREKLKFVTDNNVFQYIFKYFQNILSMFPNLQRLEVVSIEFENKNEFNEFITNIVAFLNVSSAENRQILIRKIRFFDNDLLALDAKLDEICEQTDIDADYDTDWMAQLVILSKGKASVRIIEVVERDHMEITIDTDLDDVLVE